MKHFLVTLGVSTDATWHEIREGYRDQMKVWHPDRFSGDTRLQEKAEEQSKEIGYAFRRLKELRKDIELTEAGFDDNAPFLKQYALKVEDGQGRHGLPTREDRIHGYNQDSFANWRAIRKTLITTVSESATNLARVVREARPRRRSVVVKTTRVRRGNNAVTFALCSGILVVVACIGALNLPKLMRNAPVDDENASVAEAAEVEPVHREEQAAVPESELMRAELRKSETRNSAALITNNDKPSLVAAAMNCDARAAAKLIRQGEDLNGADNGRQTALIWAARQNCPSVIRVLMSRGADHTKTSTNGFTAYRWAEWLKHDDARRSLIRYGVHR